jgi:pimeloyl-ACP methyl ester carboxylesterase
VEQKFLEEATVITVDLPGAGTADRLPPSYGFDFLTGALDRLLTEVAPGPVNVVGASYGSAVAHRWAQRHPGRARRMVLVGTMACLTDHVRARMQRSLDLLTQGRRPEFVRCVLESLVCDAPEVAVARRAAVVRSLSSALHGLSEQEVTRYLDNTRRLLAHRPDRTAPPVTVPTLVMTGAHDPLTTPAMSREAAALCADARFTTIKDADHMVHLERPAEAVDLMLRFFTGRPLEDLEYCHPVERVARPCG